MRSHPLFGRLAITVALSTWAASAPGAVPKEPFKGDKYEYNTRSGLISLRVSNLGYLGNGIVAPVASCEYPRGSNTEHLFMGGLWVGALGGQDGGVHVTTGAQDAATLQDGEDARAFYSPLHARLPRRARARTTMTTATPPASLLSITPPLPLPIIPQTS